jgi:hypothetical protein
MRVNHFVWHLALRVKKKIQVLENKVLRKIFVPMRYKYKYILSLPFVRRDASITMKHKDLHLVFQCIFNVSEFILLGTLSVISGDKDNDYEDNYNEQVNCLPFLADKCFSDVYTNLACHLDPTAPRYCEKQDVKDLCR